MSLHPSLIDFLGYPAADLPSAVLFAQRHGILPQLYHALQPHAAALPPLAWQALSRRFQAGARRSLLLAHRLAALAQAFHQHAIPCLALKGPALAVQAYDDPTLRTYGDLDLLIHPADFPAACRLLESLGYQASLPLPAPSLRWWLRFEKEYTFRRRGEMLELHWLPADRGMLLPFTAADFWASPATVDMLGEPVRTLSPHMAAWYACLHGAIHEWSQLKWVCDVAALFRNCPQLDPNAFLDEAPRLGLHRLVKTALLLAEDPGGLALPPGAHARCSADPHACRLAEEVRARALHPSAGGAGQPNTGFYLRSRPRLAHRLAYLADRLFIPRQADWLAFRLPPGLEPLYCLTRPFRLVGEYRGRREPRTEYREQTAKR